MPERQMTRGLSRSASSKRFASRPGSQAGSDQSGSKYGGPRLRSFVTTGKGPSQPRPATAPSMLEDDTELALRADTRKWLLKHGFPTPTGRLTKQQAHEIRECFDVLDADRSGTLDIDELSNAFTMLGFQVSKDSIQKVMDQVDIDKTGVLEFDEFRSIMARSMTAADTTLGSAASLLPTGASLPFEDVARMARRRQMLQDVMKGGIARQRIIDDGADLISTTEDPNAATRTRDDLQHEAASHVGQLPKQQTRRMSYYMAAAAHAREAALEMQEQQAAREAAEARAAAAAAKAKALEDAHLPPGHLRRLLTPESEQMMLDALELTGPIEGLTSMIDTHRTTKAPTTTHDLARELLDLGMPRSTLQQTLHTERLPFAADMNTSEVLWRRPDIRPNMGAVGYKLDHTYHPPGSVSYVRVRGL